MGFYGGGWVKKMISIQDPLKFVLNKITKGQLSQEDAGVLLTTLKNILELPPLEPDKVFDPNTRILIETWRDIRDQYLSQEFKEYNGFYEPIINFIASKIDYDSFYRGLVNRFLEELLRRGWQFPGHNRPADRRWWHQIPPDTKERLLKSIQDNYNLLQDRLKAIDEKFGDSDEGKVHRQSRFEQFQNRVLNDLEREVHAWE